MIDYKSLIKNLQMKPYSWWQETILNNCFEMRNNVKKEGNFGYN